LHNDASERRVEEKRNVYITGAGNLLESDHFEGQQGDRWEVLVADHW